MGRDGQRPGGQAGLARAVQHQSDDPKMVGRQRGSMEETGNEEIAARGKSMTIARTQLDTEKPGGGQPSGGEGVEMCRKTQWVGPG